MNDLFKKHPGLRAVFEQTAYGDTRSLNYLHGLVKAVGPRLVLELGTGKGCSTAFMALALPRGGGLVVTIDNYLRPDISTKGLVLDNLGSCGVLDRVSLVVGSTFEAGNLFRETCGPGARAKVVFMDSSHVAANLWREYDAVKTVLSERHYLVVDDAFHNDIHDFLNGLLAQGHYGSYLMYPYHQGLAVFSRE